MNEIDYNAVYECSDGKYKIIEDLRKEKGVVLIKFENTGNVQESNYSCAVRGIVIDKNKIIQIDNEIHQSNTFGPFIFKNHIGYDDNGRLRSLIEFIETGTQCEVDTHAALRGDVKDKYKKIIYNVACIGNPKGSNYRREYQVWHSMIARCYDINSPGYRFYGGKGVTVCERWLCFENFLEDVIYIPGYDDWLDNPGKYQLDKDKYQNGITISNKIYSLETCCFISRIENTCIMNKNKNETSNTASKYTGVSLSNEGTNYRASITVDNKKYGLGTYETEEAAANVYNAAAIRLCNGNRILNDVEPMDAMEIMNQRKGGVLLCKVVK